MTIHTVIFTFGDSNAQATGAITCHTFDAALQVASSVFTASRISPLIEVIIRPGDHGARLIDGKWVWPDPEGWDMATINAYS